MFQSFLPVTPTILVIPSLSRIFFPHPGSPFRHPRLSLPSSPTVSPVIPDQIGDLLSTKTALFMDRSRISGSFAGLSF